MPIIKSAVKRMHQTAKRRARNLAGKRTLRADTKALMSAIDAKDTKKASEELKKVQSELDKAVKKNVMKKNTAARKMAQLSAKVKAIGGKSAPSAKKPVVKKSPAKAKAKTATKPESKTATKKPSVAKKPATKKTPAKK